MTQKKKSPNLCCKYEKNCFNNFAKQKIDYDDIHYSEKGSKI